MYIALALFCKEHKTVIPGSSKKKKGCFYGTRDCENGWVFVGSIS